MQQTAEDFNYTCVVFGGALVIAGGYWFLSARHFFKGPVRPEDVAESLKEVKLVKALGKIPEIIDEKLED